MTYPKYTIPEFSEKHGLTISQCKLAACRKRFDCEMVRNNNKQLGGAKRFYLIIETKKTLSHVEKLINSPRLGHSEKSKTRMIKLKSGLEVMRNCLGLTMMGGDVL